MKTFKKILMTLPILMFLTSCSVSDVLRFSLSTPNVEISETNSLTISWEEVKLADYYIIYNASNDEKYAKVITNTYSFNKFRGRGLFYVQAYAEYKEDYVISSPKSNVVEISTLPTSGDRK